MRTMTKWYQSKTLWTGVVTAAIGIAELMTTNSLFEEHAGVLLAIIGVLNVILRLITRTPIEGVVTEDGD
jgi:hypothetical protein